MSRNLGEEGPINLDGERQLRMKIRRFNPERDDRPHWQTYTVPVGPTDRVLDALNHVKWHIDGTLTYRRSCAHGICGSDAMRINGVNRLACKVLVRDVGAEVTVEPLKALPLLKDLLVDMEPVLEGIRAVKPWLITEGPEPTRERLQSPQEREHFDVTTKCILCAACTGSCPVYWTDHTYIGPAAIVNAHRFVSDSRDTGTEEHLEVMNSGHGVWRCRTIFNCTDACPRGIPVTQTIAEVKREIVRRNV